MEHGSDPSDRPRSKMTRAPRVAPLIGLVFLGAFLSYLAGVFDTSPLAEDSALIMDAVDSAEASSREFRMPAATQAMPEREVELQTPTDSQEASVPVVMYEDEPPEEVPLAPEDPIELGPCNLELQIVEQGSAATVASWIFLYRLNAPGNELYGPGDQVQQRVFVGHEGALLTKLPEGEYRVLVDVAAYGIEAPPVFKVAGPLTRHTLTIARPRKRQAWLRLYDSVGVRLQEAWISTPKDKLWWPSERQASWIRARECKLLDVEFVISSEGSSLGGAPSSVRVSAGPQGFDLGQLVESEIGTRRTTQFWATAAGLTRVKVSVDCSQLSFAEDEEDLVLVGVLAPVEEIHASLLLGDGRDLSSIPDSLHAECTAQPLAALTGREPWRSQIIELEVTHASFEAFRLDWVPGQGPLTHQLLTPKP